MMRRIALCSIFLLTVVSIALAQDMTGKPIASPSPAPARPPAPPVPRTNLKVGDKAPDFTLPSTITAADGRSSVRYKLSDFQGKKNVVLAFYVLAFTGG